MTKIIKLSTIFNLKNLKISEIVSFSPKIQENSTENSTEKMLFDRKQMRVLNGLAYSKDRKKYRKNIIRVPKIETIIYSKNKL